MGLDTLHPAIPSLVPSGNARSRNVKFHWFNDAGTGIASRRETGMGV